MKWKTRGGAELPESFGEACVGSPGIREGDADIREWLRVDAGRLRVWTDEDETIVFQYRHDNGLWETFEVFHADG
jgi:hypothetical protein